LNSLGVGKLKILWKKVFQKIQDGGLNKKISLSCHLEFLDTLFTTKFASYQHVMNAKRRLKN
jgi:hypothetical protein